MAHFAKIDSNNIVTQLIVAEKDFINSGSVGDEFLWIQYSYNNNFRKQKAEVGFTWDKTNEVFVKPKPHDSWTLDGNHDWQPPITYPADGKTYVWVESVYQGNNSLGWVESPGY